MNIYKETVLRVIEKWNDNHYLMSPVFLEEKIVPELKRYTVYLYIKYKEKTLCYVREDAKLENLNVSIDLLYSNLLYKLIEKSVLTKEYEQVEKEFNKEVEKSKNRNHEQRPQQS